MGLMTFMHPGKVVSATIDKKVASAVLVQDKGSPKRVSYVNITIRGKFGRDEDGDTKTVCMPINLKEIPLNYLIGKKVTLLEEFFTTRNGVAVTYKTTYVHGKDGMRMARFRTTLTEEEYENI